MTEQTHEIFLSQIVNDLQDLLCIPANKKAFQEQIKAFSGYSIELQDWLPYHYTSTFNEFVQDKPVEPKESEILACEYALLGIIYDYWLAPPKCDRLCNAINDDFVKFFWEDLINSLINENASERIKSRLIHALDHVKVDLAGREEAETDSQQGKIGFLQELTPEEPSES